MTSGRKAEDGVACASPACAPRPSASAPRLTPYGASVDTPARRVQTGLQPGCMARWRAFPGKGLRDARVPWMAARA